MFKRIKRTSLVLGIALTVILGMSYGTFIFTTNSYRSTEMLVGNLTYGIEITSTGGSETINGTSVSLPSGKTSTVLLKITSLNKIISKYGVDYKITKGTGTVKYASNTGWLPTGKISENNVGTYEKVVKVVIAAETDMSVDFTVTGGFTNNELTEVETGYTRITEKADNVISYNDTLTNVVKKETTNNIYGGESTNNYAQYPINEDNTKNIWRILGTYNGIGTKIVSNQVSTTTKSTLSTDLTSFYNTLEKPDNYILSTDKFACTNTSCTSSSYSKVGLISTSEYEMLGGINSYLASSESYFALDNGTIKNITSGGIEETSTTSGLRPAVYLQDYVTVTGSGTVSDPFKLKLPEYNVILNVVNGTATLPSKMITRGENATYEITPNTGYKLVLSSNTCSNGTLSGNTFTISNVTSAQSCTITLTPESYTLTLDANDGSVSTTSKTVTYDSTYGDLPTPTRTGYTFNGWYIASTGGTKVESTTQVKTASNHTLYARWTPITYTVKYDCNGGSNAPSNQTATYDSTFTVATNTCTKTGYTFNGWYDPTNVSWTSWTGIWKYVNGQYGITNNTLTLKAQWTLNKYTLTLTKGTGVSKIYYKINGSSSYSSATSTQSLSVNYNSTYYYYGEASTGYTISSCTASSPCSGTMGTSAVSKTLSATINTYKVTLNVVNGTGSTSKTVNYNTTATFTGISPNSGYTSSNPTISCTGGTLSGTTLTVKNVTSARTCSITFKKDNPFTSGTLTYQLYKDKTTRLTSARGTGYNTVYTSDNTKTLYTSTENGTTVYYFAGNATDNWVKFGKNASNQDLYWRIIRTNSDGGVRLLYHGTSTTATDAYIGTSAFNRSYNDIAYVSYMFGSTGSISNARENTTNSTIKTTIDNWYTSNLEAKGYTKYLSRTAVYCNDRSTSDNKYFGAYTRLSINRTPTYDCTDTNDKFTVDTSTGNGKLTYPIALMTADEVSFAGGVMYTEAPTWYYYNSANGSSTGDTKWLLLSPYSWNGDANVSFVNGSSYPGGLNSSYVDSTKGVRPAISLKSCTLYSTGNGSASDPYTIEESTSGC